MNIRTMSSKALWILNTKATKNKETLAIELTASELLNRTKI